MKDNENSPNYDVFDYMLLENVNTRIKDLQDQISKVPSDGPRPELKPEGAPPTRPFGSQSAKKAELNAEIGQLTTGAKDYFSSKYPNSDIKLEHEMSQEEKLSFDERKEAKLAKNSSLNLTREFQNNNKDISNTKQDITSNKSFETIKAETSKEYSRLDDSKTETRTPEVETSKTDYREMARSYSMTNYLENFNDVSMDSRDKSIEQTEPTHDDKDPDKD